MRSLRPIFEHPVTKENVLDVANLAEENILHQPLSVALYDAAASFVKKAEGLENMLERMLDIFTDENEDHAVVVFKVIKSVKKMKSGNCSNCKQASCLNGQRLTIQNFAPAAKVRIGGYEGRIGELTATFIRLPYVYMCS